MPITAEEIRHEHQAAMTSLDDIQRQAIRRVQRSFLLARFGNRSSTDALSQVFEEEAEVRNRPAPPANAGAASASDDTST